jgi:hypothetical protein
MKLFSRPFRLPSTEIQYFLRMKNLFPRHQDGSPKIVPASSGDPVSRTGRDKPIIYIRSSER